ncbi:hypothetical protein B7Z28_00140 [Candidatus Saccharibacteria bacterium 32-45-3]|nr:MAG: hypothetical protein B7Z28_00140 [Candidatus Saccharibacteria bacterium 32-45-3]
MTETEVNDSEKKQKSIVTRLKDDNERSARRAVIEELFNDMYADRRNIYKMNFFRGISFGLGSVLGGTLLAAVTVWVLSQTVDLFPALAGFIERIIDSMNNR